MSRTARLWKGAGPATLLGCLLSGVTALGGSSPDELARQLIDLGRQAEAQDQLDQAERFFRKALEFDPASGEAGEGVRLVALRQQDEGALLGDPAAGFLGAEGEASIERARELQQVLEQQVTSDIRGRISRARALLRQNQPEAAEQTLRLALTALESADQVSQSSVEQLRRQLQLELLTVIRRGEELTQRQAELVRVESAAQRETDAVVALLRTQQNVGELMTQFNTLMNEGIFSVLDKRGTGDIIQNSQPFFDARLLAQSANALLPNATAPRAGMIVSTALGFLSQTRSYEELKEFRYMATMLDVDRAAVPFPDTITIEYPPANVFREISERRIARYEQVDLVDRSALTLEIQRKLNQPISMPFETDTPLSDALEYIRQATADENMINGIPIYVDEIGLQEAEQSLQSPIKMNLEGIPLKTTLRLMLDQLDLSYTVYDDLLEITAKGSERRGVQIRVYPVADLSLIPFSLISGGGGMGGGMGGMGGGMGGGGMGGMGGGGMGGMGGGGMGGMGGGGMMGGGMMSIPVSPQGGETPANPEKKKELNWNALGAGRPDPSQISQTASTPRGRAAQGQQDQGGTGPIVVPRRQDPVSPGDPDGEVGPTISSDEAPPIRRRPTSEELATWMAYFSGREATPQTLLEVVALLKNDGLMHGVEAALRAYLQQDRLRREPWMYEMLAVAFEYNEAKPQDVQLALGYAAIVAERPGEQGSPESLLTVVDLMAARDVFEIDVPLGEGKTRTIRVADLLDKAAERLPHRPEPLIKSLDLAERQLDADRMAWAVEGLMALGWPGVDEAWRAETRLRAVALADRLREADRVPEAEALLDRVAAAEPRDLFARLTWDGFGDLDLVVEEPLGATAQTSTPRTVFGGALVKNGRGSDAEEVYVCPRGFDGRYVFRIAEVVSDPDDPIRSPTLEVITHEGGDHEQVQTFTIDPKDPKTIEVTLEGGRRREALPYVMPKVMVLEQPGAPTTTGDPGEEPKPATPSPR